MNGFGLHVIPVVGLILLSWLGLRSLGMERGAPPAAPGWPSGCTFPEVELPGAALKRHTIGEAAWDEASHSAPAQFTTLPERWSLPMLLCAHTVTAPGRIDFGCWAFEECHALAWVGDPDQSSNHLAPQEWLNVRAFEKCRTLRTIGLERAEYDPLFFCTGRGV